jgi:hypothetical protein
MTSSDNPVRFIGAFVDGLDLTAAGFSHVAPKVTGRPGYAPTDLLKLYIYGYLNGGAQARVHRLRCAWTQYTEHQANWQGFAEPLGNRGDDRREAPAAGTHRIGKIDEVRTNYGSVSLGGEMGSRNGLK